MTADEAQTLVNHIDVAFARAEGRLTGVVNERTTRVIDATTSLAGALHREIQETGEALTTLSENIAARRVALDARLDQSDARLEALAELIPGGAEALERAAGQPPLRQVVAEHWRLTRWALFVFGALFLLLELAQWVYIARALGG